MNDKQREILVITQEECAEVIQEISKCFRFGLDNNHKSGVPHRVKLTEEVGDLLFMLELLGETGLINMHDVESAKNRKKEKLLKYSNIFVN